MDENAAARCRRAIEDVEELLRVGENQWEESYFHQAVSKLAEAMGGAHECYRCHYQCGLLYSRLVSYYLHTTRDKESAKRILEKALRHSQRSVELNNASSDSHALFGYTLAVQSGLLGFRGMTSGTRSKIEFERAFLNDASNPRLYLFRGICLYSTPKFFGGGVSRACRELTHAVYLFEERGRNREELGWGRAEAWHWLARCYAKLGSEPEALKVLRKAQSIFPDHSRLAQSLKRIEQAQEQHGEILQ